MKIYQCLIKANTSFTNLRIEVKVRLHVTKFHLQKFVNTVPVKCKPRYT